MTVSAALLVNGEELPSPVTSLFSITTWRHAADTRTARAVVAPAARVKVQLATLAPAAPTRSTPHRLLPMSVNRHSSTDSAVTGAAGPATSTRLPRVPANEDRTIRTLAAPLTTATRGEAPEGDTNVHWSKVMPLTFGPMIRTTEFTGLVMLVRVNVRSSIEPRGASAWIRISWVCASAAAAMSTEQSVNESRAMDFSPCEFFTTMPRSAPLPRHSRNEQSVIVAFGMVVAPPVHSSRATMNRLTELTPVQPT